MVLKCKMCGGDLNIEEGMTVCECEYCNTKQTVPTLDDEKKVILFTRANRLRALCEFDKAYGIYESIVVDFPEEAEAYWGLILCKYGIEYVDDPATAKKIPTCHRSSFESVMEDSNFELVMEYSDSVSRGVYRDEAKKIEELRKRILEVSSKEEPYDIFICYKETDENGERTIDSVIAQDVYKELTNEGYRVFFSRITLEDKLGQEYEPYIFAALHSAKVMLAFGTDYEYFNAVWVKNEWSRYLQLIAKGEKKTLIPCYKGIDAYDMPKEFARLQAQDMGKVGATQDLLRGIEKIIGSKKQDVVKETVVVQSGSSTSVDKMLERGHLALEDDDWGKADSFFEEVLNQNPKCAEAYLGKLLAETKCVTFDDYKNVLIEKYADANSEKLTVCDEGAELVNASVKDYVLEGYLYESTIKDVFAFDRSYDSSLSCRKSQKNKQLSEIENDKLLSRVRQYATGDTKKIVEDGLAEVSAILDRRISDAQKEDADAISEITGKYKTHLDDAYVKVNDLRVAADKKKYSVYESYAKEMTNARTANEYSIVRDKFLALKDYKNAAENAQKCQSEIDRIKAEERQKKARLARKAKRITIISLSAVVAVIAVIIIIMKIVIPTNNYNKAISFKNNGQYSEAIAAFEKLDGYKDSNEQIIICQTALKDIDYNAAVDFINNGQYNEAISAFEAMDGYRDSQNQIEACQIALKDIDYIAAVELMNNGQYDKAITAFYALDGYKDSDELIESIKASSGYISTLPVGTLFKYGSYKDLPLVWIILENNDGKIFAITNNVIEQREYNSSYTDCTWETCNLRMWLNNNFYDTAFTEEEQARIISTDVSAESGNSTQDKIYIMSVAEAEKYFTSDDDRIGRYNGSASLWWLRTPGRLVNTAAYVFTKGNIFTSGYSVSNKDCGVRPVMWISLES